MNEGRPTDEERLRADGEACEIAYRAAVWHAARDAGDEVHVLAVDTVRAAASPRIAGPAFNSAYGLDTSPARLDAVVDHFRRHGVVGWIQMAGVPFPGATSEFDLSVLLARVDDVGSVPAPPGVRLSLPPASNVHARVGALSFGLASTDADESVWIRLAPYLARDAQFHVVQASMDGREVARASLYVCGAVGIFAAGWVAPEARRRGIHASMISARGRLAAELGVEFLSSGAARGSESERNQLRLGFRVVGMRYGYRVEPS